MKTFNIIICGIGGQGILTLLKIMANAALAEGFNIKSSELHGLSQRGGSVTVHVKIGREIYSPLILPAQADLVLGIEAREALRSVKFSNSNTIFLVNKYITSLSGDNLTIKKIENNIRSISNQAYFIDATSITKRELKNPVVAGMFLLAYAGFKKFIPVSYNSIAQSTKEVIGSDFPKYLEINKKTVELVKKF
jgi:indolepyruvate ferredoxin oxidoreductase beta subunit